jgi:hypothetical protein
MTTGLLSGDDVIAHVPEPFAPLSQTHGGCTHKEAGSYSLSFGDTFDYYEVTR